MPQVFTSTVVGAPVGEVWALLRDFAAIGSWHPAPPPCEIEDGPADRVGCVRVFPLAGDHRETLGQRRRPAQGHRVHVRRQRLRAACSQVRLHDGRASDHV
jgi:Polyketide cyclase / dehydrase and lipid transport